jgi:saccharopine dehydrogenase-like NADP-dependent oxidoreductase
MKKILILGAGMSASTMIRYLLKQSEVHNWEIMITARSIEKASQKIEGHPNGVPKVFDISNIDALPALIKECDAVISMLPAKFHPIVAEEALKQSKDFFSTSYVSKEMQSLDAEAKSKGLLFLNECGVDPGIDHMSAMRVIDDIKNNGGKIIEFESNTGGLVAPEFDNNPWNYKLTWNARNVVLAGQAGAKFFQNGTYKYIPYQKLFDRTSRISVPNYGDFDVYANRDSLSYREVYGLNDIQSIVRGTLRRPGYCQAYNNFIQLGMTDDTYTMENSDKLTNKSFTEAFLPYEKGMSTEDNFCKYLGIKKDSDMFSKIQWLGMFNDNPVSLKNATPAQILQAIIEPKWALGKNDLDMIVMQHRFVYEMKGKKLQRLSTLIVIGKDNVDTAMSITVGMPLATAVELYLTGKMQASGVRVPVTPDLYNPILNAMEPLGVKFIEEEKEI